MLWRTNKKRSKNTFRHHAGLYLALVVALVVLAGGFYLLKGGADAMTDERVAIEPEGESYMYSGATHRQGDVFSQVFSANLYWEFYGGGTHPRDINHVIVVLGYKPDQTTPVAGPNGLSIVCNDTNVTCSPVGPDRYNAAYFPGGSGYTKDFAMCVEFKRPFLPGNYSSTKPPVFTVTHKMAKTGDFSWTMEQEWYSGTCAAPSGSAHGSVGVVVEGKCTYDPSVCVGGGDTGHKDPGTGPTGTGPTGTGPSGGGGGGGAAATTQGTTSNTIPSSAAQGDQHQTKIEPSPFFDGKLFATGSSVATSTPALSVGKYKVGLGWLYLALATFLLAVIGIGIWKRHAIRSFLSVYIKM